MQGTAALGEVQGMLSSAPAGAASRRAALVAVCLSLGLFAALIPLARQPLGVFPLFIPICQTVLIAADLVTATMLFAQLRVSRSAGLLALGAAYAFSGGMATVHMLSFPGVFAPGGVLGGGPQTTGWLHVMWHSGFPLLAIVYCAWSRRVLPPGMRPGTAIAGALATVALAVASLALLATRGHDWLPTMLDGQSYSSWFNVGRYGQWAITAAALAVLWRRRPHTVLDAWIGVVLTAWFVEIGLVSIFNQGRWDVGFYAGRLFGLAASLTVLVMLLVEQYRLYDDLLRARGTAESEALLRRSREMLGLAMRSGRMGPWRHEAGTARIVAGPELQAMLGLPPGDEREGVALSTFLHPDDLPRVRGALREAVEHGVEFDVDARYRGAGGDWRWLEMRGRPGDDGSGQVFGVAADVTERRREQDDARELDARFRRMADTIPQLAWSARRDGWVEWYNRRFHEYTGLTPTELEGWGWQRVHDPAVLPEVMRRWQASIASGEPFEMTFPLRGADGRFRPFLTRVSPMKDERGAVVQWFGTNTDVSAQLRAEQELRAADRRKDEFLATLSHELRNPLAPIRTAIDLIRRHDALPPPLRPLGELLERQSRHLVRLVDDLLDVSRITQGKLVLRRRPTSFAACVDEAVESVRASVQAARHELRVSVSADPLIADVDPTRIVQVVTNLLTNAIKFTPPGGRIEVASRRDGDDALLRVTDTGIGIDPDHIDGIFEMFGQVRPAIERTEGGLGIGLALVRGLVELHGGSVRARSEGAGRGAEFVVRLPLSEEVAVAGGPVEATEGPVVKAPGDASNRPGAGSGASPIVGRPSTAGVPAPVDPRGAPRRVLVVDDNRDAAATLAALLRMQGHEVEEAHDGPSGLRAAEAFRPEVVLLDLGMPGMTGYEVARALRARPGGERLRIAAVTGWNQGRDRRRTADAGFDDHLAKPVEWEDLAKVLAAKG